MPLVVPGITSQGGGGQQQEWLTKLAGKKIADTHDETASLIIRRSPLLTRLQSFAKNDLPKNHRVVQPDAMLTQDVDQNRFAFLTLPQIQAAYAHQYEHPCWERWHREACGLQVTQCLSTCLKLATILPVHYQKPEG